MRVSMIGLLLGGIVYWLSKSGLVGNSIRHCYRTACHRSDLDGYVTYNSWSGNVRVTERYYADRSYQPLNDARIIAVETGQ